MKKIVITCDFCKKVLNDEYIRLGSENEKEFSFHNKLPNIKKGKLKISRGTDLHFCSKEHFINYFFEKEL